MPPLNNPPVGKPPSFFFPLPKTPHPHLQPLPAHPPQITPLSAVRSPNEDSSPQNGRLRRYRSGARFHQVSPGLQIPRFRIVKIVCAIREGRIVPHKPKGVDKPQIYGLWTTTTSPGPITYAGNVQLVPDLLPLPDPVIVHTAANVQVDF